MARWAEKPSKSKFKRVVLGKTLAAARLSGTSDFASVKVLVIVCSQAKPTAARDRFLDKKFPNRARWLDRSLAR
jgi:hypothetical protein